MVKDDRKKLEENDLAILHSWFESENSISSESEDLEYPRLPVRMNDDFWSEIVNVFNKCDKDKYQRLNAKLKYSLLSDQGKQWWMSLLTIMSDSPLDELEILANGNIQMPSGVSDECLLVVSRILAKNTSEIKRRHREKAYMLEEQKLKALELEANELQQKKNNAEANLQRHRGQ